MYFSKTYLALAGLASMASAAPAPAPVPAPLQDPVSPKVTRQVPIAPPIVVQQNTFLVPVIQQIQETNIVIIQNQNLELINELALLAEQQFAARIQAEVALVNQLFTIQNNIRINHFRSMFRTVNTIIVTVTNVLDLRDPLVPNNRYLINQLLANNGHAESQIVVMLTASETMTIGGDATATASSSSFSSTEAETETATADEEDAEATEESEADEEVDAEDEEEEVKLEEKVRKQKRNLLPSFLGNDPNAIETLLAQLSPPLNRQYDPLLPFGSLEETILLPYGTLAPTHTLVFQDPASIILPPSPFAAGAEAVGAGFAPQGLFIENSQTLARDCALFAALGNSFFSSGIQVFPSFGDVAVSHALGLVLGVQGPPLLPLLPLDGVAGEEGVEDEEEVVEEEDVEEEVEDEEVYEEEMHMDM